ncbi:hypothetical protein Q9189_008176, partial [Teloschistes chrysophthalmus]
TPNQNQNLTLHPLPNPYDIPNTPLSVDFHGAAPIPLPPTDYSNCITQAGFFVAYRAHHTPGPIPHDLYPIIFQTRCRSVWYEFSLERGGVGMRWEDAVSVLRVVGWKMGREGVRQRIAFVVETETGVDVGAMAFTRIAVKRPGPREVETA